MNNPDSSIFRNTQCSPIADSIHLAPTASSAASCSTSSRSKAARLIAFSTVAHARIDTVRAARIKTAVVALLHSLFSGKVVECFSTGDNVVVGGKEGKSFNTLGLN
jgi:hypothetical protein